MDCNKLFSDRTLKAVTKFYGLLNLTPAQKRAYLMKGGIAAGLGFGMAGIGAGYRHFFGNKDKKDSNNGGNNSSTTDNSDTSNINNNSHDQSTEVTNNGDVGGESHWYNPMSWFGGGD